MSKTTQIVNDWFARYIHNSPASRNEQTYNYLYKAKDALINDLAAAEKEIETVTPSTTVAAPAAAEPVTEEQPETPENQQKEG